MDWLCSQLKPTFGLARGSNADQPTLLLNCQSLISPASLRLCKPRAMSYGSVSHTIPGRSRPSRTPATPPPIDYDGDYFSARRNSGAFDGLNKRARRGKSPHDIMREGAISSEERSLEFEGIPVDEKEIGRLPRKVSYPLT